MSNISNSTANFLVSGTSAADSIRNSASGVTLHGAGGNDTLTGSSYAEVFRFRSDGGNDVITNFGTNDTLHIAAGKLNSYYADGNDLVVHAKGTSYSGTIRLKNAASQTIKLKELNSAVQTINTVNVIDNRTRNTIISGSGVRDSIYNYAKNVTINADKGSDTVQTYGNSVKVDGGAGNDLIKTTGGSGVTLHGGEGNDTLTGSASAEVFQFRSDGGSDVITNFGVNDTLHIAAGSFNSYYIDGDDLIVAAKGAKYSGEIRLQNTASQAVKLKVGTKALQTLNAVNVIDNRTRNTIIAGSSRADSIYNYAKNVTINALDGDDTIQTFGNSVKVDGGAGADSIKSTGGVGVTLHGGEGADTLTGSSSAEVFQYSSDGGSDVITNFGKNDTLHIAAGSFNSYYIDDDDLIVAAKGAKYSGKIRLQNAASQAVKLKVGTKALQTINAFNVLSNTTQNTIISGSSRADSIYNYARNVTINALDGDDTIQTSGNYVKVEGGDGNDSIKSMDGLGVTLHGGEGNDTLTGSSSAEVFVFRSDGGDDIITNFGVNDTLHIAAGSFNSYYIDGNDLIVAAKGAKYSGEIRLQNAASQAVKLKVGTKALQTLNDVNVISNTTQNTIISGSSGADSIYNYARNVTINALDGDDTIQTYGNSVKVEGGSGNDSIKTTGGSGVTLHGGEGNDTLTGSTSAELFQFRSDGGADVITNFGVNDTLHIAAGSFNSYYIDGDDLIIAAKGAKYSGEIRLQNAASQAVKLKVGTKALQTINAVNVISNTTQNTIISGTSRADSIYNYARNVTINALDDNDTIETYGDSVKVDGGAGNDSIKSTGGSGVTLHGGEGNDTLTGSSSAEVFVFRSDGGADVITNFDTDDTLSITDGSIVGYGAVDDDALIVTVRSSSSTGTIRMESAADKPIKVKVGFGSLQTINASGTESIGTGITLSNSVNNTIINGTSYADSLFNYGSMVTIRGEAGNDTIRNRAYGSRASLVAIDAGDGDDSVDNSYGHYVTINTGDGNDSVYNSGDYATINTGDGDDSVYNSGDYATINTGNGHDSVYNYGLYATINTGNGNDSVHNADYCATINTGEGDDSVKNRYSNYTMIYTGEGNDSVYNSYSHYATINTGEGDDSVYNYSSSSSTINTGDGNDSVYNGYSDHATINTGEGDDSVENRYSHRATINTGDGNDSVYNYSSSSSTINTGQGNDMISLNSLPYNTHIYYAEGDGDDTILGFDGNDTLHLPDGMFSGAYVEGDDVLLQVGFDFIRFKNAKADNTSIKVFAKNQLYTLQNFSQSVEGGIDGEFEDPSVLDNQTLVGTDGKDYITNGGNNVSIVGLAGNDVIKNELWDTEHRFGYTPILYYLPKTFSGDNVTINAGTGNDTIDGNSSKREIYQYARGDGNDTIYGFNGAYVNYSYSTDAGVSTIQHDGDTLNVTQGSIKRAFTDGNDVVLLIGDNSIRLKDAKNQEIIIAEDEGSIYSFTGSYVKPPYLRTVGANETIQATHEEGESVTGTNGTAFIDEFDSLSTDDQGNINQISAVNQKYKLTTPDGSNAVAVEDSLNNGIASVIGSANFTWKNRNTYISAVEDKPLKVTLQADSIVVESGKGNDTITCSEHADTLRFNLGNGNDVVYDYSFDDTIELSCGRVSSASLDGNDVVMNINADEGSIRLKNAKGKLITFVNANRQSRTFENEYWSISDDALKEAKNFLDRLDKGLNYKLKASAMSESDTTTVGIFQELKKQLVTDSSIPDEVYKAIADAVAQRIDEINAATPNGYSNSTFGVKAAQQIYDQIKTGLDQIPNRSVTVKGEKYSIDFMGSFVLSHFINITLPDGSEKLIAFNYGQAKALAKYCADVKNLVSEIRTQLVLECAVGLDGDAAKFLTEGDGLSHTLAKIMFDDINTDVTYTQVGRIQDVVSTFKDGKKIIQAAEQLESLRSDYYNLDTMSDYYEFMKAGNKIAQTVGVEKVDLHDSIFDRIGDWFNGLFNGFFNELPASEPLESYWLEKIEQSEQAVDEIVSILRSDQNDQNDRAVAFEFEPGDRFKPSIELVSSARSRLKK